MTPGPDALSSLDHPILFAAPRRLTPHSAWREHIPLGMLLVDLVRPRTLVELGTQAGDSYCAFCQAVDGLGLDTACYAVDTWEGDEHSGFYGPEVLTDLRAHHDPAYGSFSRLVQSSFEQALARFEDGTIDLLHIDGHHTYESVKSDFEGWLPKISERGVVLLHDTNVLEGDFGVRRLWEELRPQYPHFEVKHGHGLGVLAVGADPESLAPLTALDEEQREGLRGLLFALGERLAARSASEGRSADEERVRADRAREQLGAAGEALRLERELAARREDERVVELAELRAEAEAQKAELWSWCVRAELHREEAERMRATRGWRYTQPLRRAAGVFTRRARRTRIELPAVEAPRARLVVPVHSNVELTEATLRSIAANTPPIYELVLADDDSDPRTARLLRSVRGARLVANERNLGFTETVNRASEGCEGEFLVICNNDIEVRPGWLERMIECAESDSRIAVVVPKFLRPDGAVAEAGGIVFSDGSATHVGTGSDVNDFHFNFRREVDYGSAAAMLVRADFWREVGGFDERFSPGYWEDADLCFAARARGLKVVYEPKAEVVHVQGGSFGVDEEAGPKTAIRVNAPKFAEKWRAELPNQSPSTDDPVALRAAADRARGPRVLVIDHRVPSPDVDSGSVRMKAIVRTLVGMGCSVRFLPDNGFRWEPYCSQLEELGVEVMYGNDARGEIEQIGAELDLAILSRPATAARFLHLVRECAPGATVAYDTVDLHFVREGRRAELEGGGEQPVVRALREVELAMVRGTDATICVSEEEAETVRREVPGARTLVISNVHEAMAEAPVLDSREGLLFVGDFIHTPNVDAARFLLDEVMPLVWGEAPDAIVRIIGNGAEEHVGTPADGRVRIEGWVDDVEEYMDRSRVTMAPLRYGAGVKGKITHSLARGLPVVTTTVGAEGLGATAGEDLLIADDAEGLATEAVKLVGDDELWHNLAVNGLALAQRRFSTDRVAEALRSLLPNGASGP